MQSASSFNSIVHFGARLSAAALVLLLIAGCAVVEPVPAEEGYYPGPAGYYYAYPPYPYYYGRAYYGPAYYGPNIGVGVRVR